MERIHENGRRASASRSLATAVTTLLALAAMAGAEPVRGAPPDADEEPGALASPRTVDGYPIARVLPPDAIRALDAPSLVRAAEARSMADDEPVIAVVVDGEARAYALDRLDWHEVVNDRARGRPIAVTW